jgi:hypothetical protein
MKKTPKWKDIMIYTEEGKMKKCMSSELHKIAMHGKAQTFARMYNCKKKLNASMISIKDMPPILK